jgi:DNA-directed RNA polymerase subunit F
MTRKGKITRKAVGNTAYLQAFARLDAALAKNARSRMSDIEKIDRLRLAVFGCLPDPVKIQK